MDLSNITSIEYLIGIAEVTWILVAYRMQTNKAFSLAKENKETLILLEKEVISIKASIETILSFVRNK